jgi:sRNA-binding protein
MGDPVTIGLSVAGSLFSAMEQRNAGIAAQQQANAQAALMEQQAKAQVAIAQNQQKMLDSQASQMESIAGQERAMSQRTAMEQRRRQRLAQSRVVALAAAQTGDSLDPSIINLIGDLEAEGSFAARSALFTGEERARDLETQASFRRAEGELTAQTGATQAAFTQYGATMTRAAGAESKRAGNASAISTILKGGTSLMDKYGDKSAADLLR